MHIGARIALTIHGYIFSLGSGRQSANDEWLSANVNDSQAVGEWLLKDRPVWFVINAYFMIASLFLTLSNNIMYESCGEWMLQGTIGGRGFLGARTA